MSAGQLSTGAAVSLASVSMADDATVTVGDLTRTGATAIGHVSKAPIGGPLGSNAVIAEGLSNGSVRAAGMDKGDGSADLHTDPRMLNRQWIWDQHVVGTRPQFGTELKCAPSCTANRVSVAEDIRGPEAAAVIDNDGNGKGEHWTGDAGWKSTRMRQVNRLLQPHRQWPAPARSSSCWRRMPETGRLARCPPA